MNILGINSAYHDSTACVVQDGRLTVALEEERLTRQKHTSDFPLRAIARCLEIAHLSPREIDQVAVSVKPTLDRTRKAVYGMKLGLKAIPLLYTLGTQASGDKSTTLKSWFKATFPAGARPRLHFVPHHFAHAVGSFDVSPYEKAALLSVDGVGEWPTTFKGAGKGIEFECFGQDRFPMSLGEVYKAATEFCGFGDFDEGKTMGLAPLGDPKTFGPLVDQLFWVNEDMSLGIDLSYFQYPSFQAPMCGKKFHATFGPPRSAQARRKIRAVAPRRRCRLSEEARRMPADHGAQAARAYSRGLPGHIWRSLT